jgi:serine/threonine protein kinase
VPSRRFEMKAGDRVGKWTLIDPLGRGGNAEVWLARSREHDQAALKVLRRKDRNPDAFQRFCDEIRLLKHLGPCPGIVPIIETSLGDGPKDRQWIAMAVAEPIREGLGQPPPLERVVSAISRVADTLSSLASRNISHRDIKPENLYWFEGDAAIGDSGLADFPEKTEITKDGRWLGPLHFMAPEMLTNPATAEGEPADVYSLAKTLWVLATEQKWPPPGPHRLDEPSTCLRSYVNHVHVDELDLLIERSTSRDPTARPTMEQFAAELTAWLAPELSSVDLPSLELDHLAAKIRTAHEVLERENTLRSERLTNAERTLNDLASVLLPIGEILRKAGVSEGTVSSNPDICRISMADRPGELLFREGRVLPLGGRPWMYIGVGVCAYADGIIRLVAGYILGSKSGGSEILWHRFEEHPMGSAIERLGSGLRENLSEYAAKVLGRLRALGCDHRCLS